MDLNICVLNLNLKYSILFLRWCKTNSLYWSLPDSRRFIDETNTKTFLHANVKQNLCKIYFTLFVLV